jgi:hypothetical protein
MTMAIRQQEEILMNKIDSSYYAKVSSETEIPSSSPITFGGSNPDGHQHSTRCVSTPV